MSNKNEATVLPFSGSQPDRVSTDAPETFTSVIMQGAFASEADRQEFMQAISMHGVTFMRCGSSLLSRPTIDDLSLFERLAKSLNRVWPNHSGKAVRS